MHAAVKERLESGSALKTLAKDGFALIEGPAPGSPPAAQFDRLLASRGGGSRRVAPTHDLVGNLLAQPAIQSLVADTIGTSAVPIRAIAFDKTEGGNWSVPWHQDRSIAVDRRNDEAGVRNWTLKAGIPHCEPPVGVLERMVTLRWHLDDMSAADGGLQVLPGSHRLGRLTSPEIADVLASTRPADVSVPEGWVMVMRPLLVHRSCRRARSGRRRVLHVELAAGDPPPPLRWAWAQGDR